MSSLKNSRRSGRRGSRGGRRTNPGLHRGMTRFPWRPHYGAPAQRPMVGLLAMSRGGAFTNHLLCVANAIGVVLYAFRDATPDQVGRTGRGPTVAFGNRRERISVIE